MRGKRSFITTTNKRATHYNGPAANNNISLEITSHPLGTGKGRMDPLRKQTRRNCTTDDSTSKGDPTDNKKYKRTSTVPHDTIIYTNPNNYTEYPSSTK